MVRGNIYLNYDGEESEKEIKDCDMILALGIKDAPDGANLQCCATGGMGLSTKIIANSIAMFSASVVNQVGENQGMKERMARHIYNGFREYCKKALSIDVLGGNEPGSIAIHTGSGSMEDVIRILEEMARAKEEKL